MLDNFLSEYTMVAAHIIYLFYLTLKYKKTELFDILMLNTPTDISDQLKQYPKISKLVNNNIWIDLSLLYDKDKFEKKEIHGTYNSSGEMIFNGVFFIKNATQDIISIKYHARSSFPCWDSTTLTNVDNQCIGKSLFYPDLQNWDTIKHYTYREYLHKQLEMYNFVQEESE